MYVTLSFGGMGMYETPSTGQPTVLSSILVSLDGLYIEYAKPRMSVAFKPGRWMCARIVLFALPQATMSLSGVLTYWVGDQS